MLKLLFHAKNYMKKKLFSTLTTQQSRHFENKKNYKES